MKCAYCLQEGTEQEVKQGCDRGVLSCPLKFPTRRPTSMSRAEGLKEKYYVSRVDGKPHNGGIFLEFDDPNSIPALRIWAATVRASGYTRLADDIEEIIKERAAKKPIAFPWESGPLKDWAICGMNHYTLGVVRHLFVSMVKDGRFIKAEGPFESLVWQSLEDQANAIG